MVIAHIGSETKQLISRSLYPTSLLELTANALSLTSMPDTDPPILAKLGSGWRITNPNDVVTFRGTASTNSS